MILRAIAFDIDGTLYPNWVMHLRSIPFFLSRPRLIWNFGRVRKDIRKQESITDFYQRQAEMLAERMRWTPEKAREVINRDFYGSWEKIFVQMKTFPGVRESLDAFREKGLKLAAMSDFPPGNKLSYLGLENLWDVIFSSQDTGYLKPHAQPFLETAKRLGEKPENILYVGNSYPYDVEGARAAGMVTAHIGKPRQKDPADFEFRHYGELRDFVLARLDDR